MIAATLLLAASPVTHWPLADGRDVEILNILDDPSRLLTGTTARRA